MPAYFFHIVIELQSTAALKESSSGQSNSSKSKNSPEFSQQALPFIPPREISDRLSRKYDLGLSQISERVEETPRKEAADLQFSVDSPAGDWRPDKISILSVGMLPDGQSSKNSRSKASGGQLNSSIGTEPGNLTTKGSYEPSELEGLEVGWGIVHLYRDAKNTPGLNDDAVAGRNLGYHKIASNQDGNKDQLFQDEDCTTLSILAVPSYLTPSDFLGFVGEKTRDNVSHFRMIRTEKSNRYMVLMKFRSGKKAREWRKEWNGKAFNSMEPENCHVVFVKSIEFRTHQTNDQDSSFPNMANDPFTPSVVSGPIAIQSSSASTTSFGTKPVAPPTPRLVELPTCPVCLERMDETTGLLTILCQHVFHCLCLQKWKGSGCPVCRYTQDDAGKKILEANNHNGLNECSVCRSEENLWMCLICGNVGCGRYEAAHAFSHYQDSSHCFAIDLITQRIWDYASDAYVHRISQNKTDGKFEQLSPGLEDFGQITGDFANDDFIPRQKLDNIVKEYTHLLTSQLDSQRMYFEEKVERAADKASSSSIAAEKAKKISRETTEQLHQLQVTHDSLANKALPELERDNERALRRAQKFEDMARKLEKEWREEKAMNGSLMEKIEHLKSEMEKVKVENQDLQEQNRDLGMFISSRERLKDAEGEIREGTVVLGDAPSKGKKKSLKVKK